MPCPHFIYFLLNMTHPSLRLVVEQLQGSISLQPRNNSNRSGVRVCDTDRGGDITYHGPGQLVGYPIFDLNALSLRLHGYMRFLEGVDHQGPCTTLDLKGAAMIAQLESGLKTKKYVRWVFAFQGGFRCMVLHSMFRQTWNTSISLFRVD